MCIMGATMDIQNDNVNNNNCLVAMLETFLNSSTLYIYSYLFVRVRSIQGFTG